MRYSRDQRSIQTPMNILLVGEEAAGIQTLRLLAQSKHRVVGVLASPEKRGSLMASLWNTAEGMGYPTSPVKLVRDPDFAERMRSEEVDILLNVHSLFVICSKVVTAPRYGSFNLHPGPLPRYAGLNAVSWALYRGERTHGVTLHKMDPGIDTGAIVYQSIFDIEETDTALTLSAKCVRKGLELIARLLEVASNEPKQIPLLPQDLSNREYFGRQVPRNGNLSWRLSAREIYNFVRACDYFPFRSAWGYPRARLTDREIAIVKAGLTDRDCDAEPGTVGSCGGLEVEVACADKWIRLKQILIEGIDTFPAGLLKTGDRLADG
jgi:methionyl-tRNA formyltransferase